MEEDITAFALDKPETLVRNQLFDRTLGHTITSHKKTPQTKLSTPTDGVAVAKRSTDKPQRPTNPSDTVRSVENFTYYGEQCTYRGRSERETQAKRQAEGRSPRRR
jgi:hypothetical protein